MVANFVPKRGSNLIGTAHSRKVSIHGKEFELFIPEHDLDAAIDNVAVELAARYGDLHPLFIGVLNGAFFFAAELMKRLDIDLEITFVKIASYSGTQSTGNVKELIGLNEQIEGRHVVILEDIVDTGNTVRSLVDRLMPLRPAGIAIATLLFKPDAYRQNIPIDHAALRIPDVFVVGSGLDHDGSGRNLRGIYRIIQEKK